MTVMQVDAPMVSWTTLLNVLNRVFSSHFSSLILWTSDATLRPASWRVFKVKDVSDSYYYSLLYPKTQRLSTEPFRICSFCCGSSSALVVVAPCCVCFISLWCHCYFLLCYLISGLKTECAWHQKTQWLFPEGQLSPVAKQFACRCGEATRMLSELLFVMENVTQPLQSSS